MKQNCLWSCFWIINHPTFISYCHYKVFSIYLHRKQIRSSDFEVDPVVVGQVWIVQIPVSPFPKRRGHFIQQSALGFVTENMLPQTSPPGRQLLPQFLLVSSLCSANKCYIRTLHVWVLPSRNRKSVRSLPG